MGKTKIEWATHTWNPVAGCSKVSEGCLNCYAERIHTIRYKAWQDGWKAAPVQYHEPFEKVQIMRDRWGEPIHWRKPHRVFCCSMSDLFHEDISEATIMALLSIMENANSKRMKAGKVPHTFMLLTKRAERMKRVVNRWFKQFTDAGTQPDGAKHIWFGVSVENQKAVTERVPHLLAIRAPVPIIRFVSVEPLLGPIDLRYIHLGRGVIYDALAGETLNPQTGSKIQPGTGSRINWVIVGGETGPGARPMHPDWVHSLLDQTLEAPDYIPFFFKQWGEWFPREQWEFNPDLILPDDDEYEHDPKTLILNNHTVMHRVGRRKAGHLLDGMEWQDWPEAKR